LELVAWVSRCSLKTKNSLNWLFSENWESKSSGNMREFLILSPLNVIFGAHIMVVMTGCWLISQVFLMLQLNI